MPIRSAADIIEEHYIFPDKGEECAAVLRAELQSGAFEGIREPLEICRLVNEHLYRVCCDHHLKLRYRNPKQSHPSGRERLAARNFGFRRAEILEGNVGRLDLRGFAPLEWARATAASALGFLIESDAMIIDLRSNGGGAPDMIAFLCSYFFPPVPRLHLNTIHLRDGRYVEFHTLPHIPGKRYLNKPLYLLTGPETFSGAEEFVCNLRNLNRAVAVGERTRGGAHPTRSHALPDGYTVDVPFGRSINPVSGDNWEQTGIAPDIPVAAASAPDIAHLTALEEIRASGRSALNSETLEHAIGQCRESLARAEQNGLR